MRKKRDTTYLKAYGQFKAMWKKMNKENSMTTEIIAVNSPEPLALTAQEIRANVNLIQQVLKSVFVKDVHYGTIPGTDKPTLYKPGAEKILVLFRLNAKPIIEDLSKDDEIRYRVSVMVTHQITRHEIGWGVGECSSNETKYKWVKIKNLEEWANTPEDQRRTITKTTQGGKEYKIQQIRSNIADVANTVLKMAKKRALVDATLTCTAASDVFDQDLEDLPEGMRQEVADKKPPMPQRAADKPAPAQQQSAEEENDSTEDPPQRVSLANARKMDAKFDAPCKSCGAKIATAQPMLYIGDGPTKGRYCVSHAA